MLNFVEKGGPTERIFSRLCLGGVYDLYLCLAIVGARIENLLYATIFHLLAGTMTGSVFKVRALFLLLGLVLFESVFLAVMLGSVAGLWALANLVGVQIGYVGGIYGRSILEQAGYLLPNTRARRLP